MNPLKLIWLTIMQLAKQAWSLPKTIAEAIQQRQQRAMGEALEAERLDRIRNPSKYVGK
jgi:hypothetical protein